METTAAATTPTLTALESRALELLGNGVSPEQTAAALGVSASRISQMLSEEHFAQAVTQRRYEALCKHNERDSNYDALEDKLLKKMTDLLPMMVRPMEILKALQVVNQAKRRGSNNIDGSAEQKPIVELTIPVTILQQFTTNQLGQVVQAGSQSLETIQAGALLERRKEQQNVRSVSYQASDF